MTNQSTIDKLIEMHMTPMISILYRSKMQKVATVSHSKTEWTVALSLPSALFFFLLFSFTKKEISTRQGQYLFLLIIIHLSSFRSILLPKRNVLLSIFHTD